MMESDEMLPFDVLVVDDERMIRELLRRVLENVCRSVTTAESGQEAIDLLETREFQLVITDLRMPGKGGLDVLRAAHARSVAIRLLVISGFVERSDEQIIESFGALLLRKPFDPTRLITSVRALVARG
jgi:two-component system response regulator PilR (NtrC family)